MGKIVRLVHSVDCKLEDKKLNNGNPGLGEGNWFQYFVHWEKIPIKECGDWDAKWGDQTYEELVGVL